MLMVVVFHAWWVLHWTTSPLYRPAAGQSAPWISALGNEGVSLFLVLSGFCLSLKPWQRLQSGHDQWFVPSEFFARRCLRILPPYYAALALTAVATSLAAGSAIAFAFPGQPTFQNIALHVLLLHNLTPHEMDFDMPFWSLGLEWQWYFAFPVVLIAIARHMQRALVLILMIAGISLLVVFGVLVHLNTGLPVAYFWTEPRPLLPERLFEFACGVAAARLAIMARSTTERPLLGAALAATAFAGALWGWQLLQPQNLEHLVGGLGFGIALGCVYASRLAHTVLAWRPLVRVGIMSYSIYLVHDPVLQCTEYILARAGVSEYALMPLGIVSGITAGVLFYHLVERWFIGRRAWSRWGRGLTACFRWADHLYPPGMYRRTTADLEPSTSPVS